jgi:hypothetical protein
VVRLVKPLLVVGLVALLGACAKTQTAEVAPPPPPVAPPPIVAPAPVPEVPYVAPPRAKKRVVVRKHRKVVHHNRHRHRVKVKETTTKH